MEPDGEITGHIGQGPVSYVLGALDAQGAMSKHTSAGLGGQSREIAVRGMGAETQGACKSM